MSENVWYHQQAVRLCHPVHLIEGAPNFCHPACKMGVVKLCTIVVDVVEDKVIRQNVSFHRFKVGCLATKMCRSRSNSSNEAGKDRTRRLLCAVSTGFLLSKKSTANNYATYRSGSFPMSGISVRILCARSIGGYNVSRPAPF